MPIVTVGVAPTSFPTLNCPEGVGVSVSSEGAVVDTVVGDFVTGISITPHAIRSNNAEGIHTRGGPNTMSVEFDDGNSSTAIVRFGETV